MRRIAEKGRGHTHFGGVRLAELKTEEGRGLRAITEYCKGEGRRCLDKKRHAVEKKGAAEKKKRISWGKLETTLECEKESKCDQGLERRGWTSEKRS